MRLNQNNQSTFALFLWLAFFNAQILMAVVIVFQWRLNHPGIPLSSMVYWDEAFWRETAGWLVLAVVTFLSALGMTLGFKYYAQPIKPNLNLLILSFLLVEMTGVLGVVTAMTRTESALGLPFVAMAMLLLGALFPSGRRFSRREVGS